MGREQYWQLLTASPASTDAGHCSLAQRYLARLGRRTRHRPISGHSLWTIWHPSLSQRRIRRSYLGMCYSPHSYATYLLGWAPRVDPLAGSCRDILGRFDSAQEGSKNEGGPLGCARGGLGEGAREGIGGDWRKGGRPGTGPGTAEVCRSLSDEVAVLAGTRAGASTGACPPSPALSSQPGGPCATLIVPCPATVHVCPCPLLRIGSLWTTE